jgi:putative sigma-54 modulation protein
MFMQVQFAFKHMRSSEATQDYAEKKVIEKISKFVTKPIDILVTFSKDGLMCIAHCSLKGGDGFNFQVEQSSEDMRSAVDLMVDRLATQLKRHKEKLKEHKGSKAHLRAVPDVVDEFEGPIDADEVIKFEQARRRASGHN